MLTIINNSKELSKSNLYKELHSFLQSLIGEEQDMIANMANMSSLLYFSLPNINWSGFYIFDGHELVLGPFHGKPACVRIPMGKGVCGTSALNRTIIMVEDVHQFPGHIACDAASNSEIVIPIIVNDVLIGVLDIDSPIICRFDLDDKEGLESLVNTLIHSCTFKELEKTVK